GVAELRALALGKSEVEELDAIALWAAREEDIPRLEVTVNQTCGMRARERRAHRRDDAQRRRHREGTATPQVRLELLTFEELHHDIGNTLIQTVIVHLSRVVNLQLRGNLRFTLEAQPPCGGAGVLRIHELDSDIDVELEVPSHPDDPHTPVRQGPR